MHYSRKHSDIIQYDNEVIEIAFIAGMTIIIFMMILMYIILW